MTIFMTRGQIRTIEQAFVYIADCQLATVSGMAFRKSRSKGEYQRHISIAQAMVDWCIQFEVEVFETRARDVIFKYVGSVADWAKQYET